MVSRYPIIIHKDFYVAIGSSRSCLSMSAGCAICYASANIKALETLGYAEHICNYVVILDSWFYGKISVIRKARLSTTRCILEFS